MNLPPYTLTQTTPPAKEPLGIDDARAFLQINFAGPNATLDDDLVEGLISAAREDCEFRTGRSFITQGWRLEVDAPLASPLFPWGYALGFPWCGGYSTGRTPPDPAIRLPKPSLISVQSVSYRDGGGTTRTLDPSAYRVSPGTPGRIVPANGQPLPLWNSMAVEYTAGFGPDPADVPVSIIQAIKNHVAFAYVNRTDDQAEPAVIDRLLRRWKVASYA